MAGDSPPPEVLAAAGLSDQALEAVGNGARVWVATTPNGKVVLRRCSPGGHSSWLRDVLTVLNARLPVPKPMPLFDSRCSFEHPTGTWEALSFLAGREIGFNDQPSLQAVGAFLASFHQGSVETTGAVGPRPSGARLTDLGHVVDWDRAVTTMGSPDAVGRLRGLLDAFIADLAEVGYANLETCVVHGDPTTFNVLADGEPLHPSGLIDFELADVEAPVADVAFCLWRSGRPAQHVRELDYARVRALVTGYHSQWPLTDAELAAIPVCLRGRGLQMLAKRTGLGVADDSPLEELLWIDAHQDHLLEAVTGAVA